MKNRYSAPLLAGLLILALSSAGAQVPSPQGALERIASQQQINVGFSEDAPPFSVRGAGGHPVGYSIDLCNAVIARIRAETGAANLRVVYQPVSTDQLVRIVRSSGVDLMCAGVSDTPARRTAMSFSAPIFISAVKFAVRTRDGIRAPADLAGKTVAVMGRTTAEPAVLAFAEAHKLDLKISRVAGADAAMGQLRLNHATAWARDEVLLLGGIARQPDAAAFTVLPTPLSSETIALAFPQDHGLQGVVDRALSALASSGRTDALYEQWFVKPNAAVASGLKLPMSAELKASLERQR
ncbi:MAG TPA: transporter substrate-binding domain-containing protein [Ramlibacter sp.]|nr:transporter substrate-binding domain-containing protein [Ramlibacter sp.]